MVLWIWMYATKQVTQVQSITVTFFYFTFILHIKVGLKLLLKELMLPNANPTEATKARSAKSKKR